MRRLIPFFLLCLAGGTVFLLYNMQSRDFTWQAVQAHLDTRWGHIPRIPPAELQRRLADPARAPILIDARSAEEFRVSHLPNARRSGHDAGVEALAPTLPASAALVVYCANGLRAAPVAHRLRGLGFPDACILDGGIFTWAALGLPLTDGTRPVTTVHPWTKVWSRLLDEARRQVEVTSSKAGP